MAFGKMLKNTTRDAGRGRVWITRRASGRNKGKNCVISNGNKRAFKGASDFRFWGCFNSRADAERRVDAVASGRRSFGGSKRKSRRRSRR